MSSANVPPTYREAEISGNLFKAESWERVLKFCGVNIVIGILIALVVGLIIAIVGPISMTAASIAALGVVLIGQAFALSWYESWRQCNFPVKN